MTKLDREGKSLGEALESSLPTVSFRRIIGSRLFHPIPEVLTTSSR